MILITGATGHLGSATIDFLLQKLPPSQIAALVRDESKATGLAAQGVSIRVGSYDDTASLDQAMQGIEKVLLIAGTDETNRLRQHQNVVEAAKKASVSFIAYTSRALKNRATLVNRLMEGHFQTEDLIVASGLSYALFRNILYMDTIPQFVGEKVFETGIHLPAGQGRVSFALRREMGEAIANVLASDTSQSHTYHLTGSEAYSFSDIAAALTDLSGKPVAYAPAETPAFEQQMRERGVPDAVIRRVVGFMTDIANGQESEVSPDLERLLGRRPASLRAGLKLLYQL